MRKWIVKQNLELNGLEFKTRKAGDKPIISTKIGGAPGGVKSQKGDQIYLYEEGFIYEKGEIIEAFETMVFHNYEAIVNYYNSEKNLYKNSFWWGTEVLKKAYRAFQHGKSYQVSVRVLQSDLLTDPIFIGTSKYKGEHRWRKITEKIEEAEVEIEIKTTIPGHLKLKLIEKYSLKGEKSYYDIDHFVPKSLGGPGNLEQNLRPLGAGANRHKGNKVPKGLFITATNEKFQHIFPEHLIKKIKNSKEHMNLNLEGNNFLSNPQDKDWAKTIINNLNKTPKLSLNEKREFYKMIKQKHNLE